MTVLIVFGVTGVVWFVVTRYYRWIGQRAASATARPGVSRRVSALASLRRSWGESLVTISNATGKPALIGGSVLLAVAIVINVAQQI